MKCDKCQSWDKEEGCLLPPSEMDDPTCLLRHACVMLNLIYEELTTEDDGESWKNTP